jgi:predicted transcriptional regulator
MIYNDDTPYQRMAFLIQKHAPRLMREGAFETVEAQPKRIKFYAEEISQMRKLRAAGKTLKEIAETIGCSTLSVRRHA